MEDGTKIDGNINYKPLLIACLLSNKKKLLLFLQTCVKNACPFDVCLHAY